VNRLMRMAFGHGGTRLERVIVNGSLPETAPTPLWLRLLLLAVWIVVVVLVSRYVLPNASLPMKTIIDISKLTVKPPPALEKPVRPKPERILPVESPPPPLPTALPEPVIRKPLERRTTAPPLAEVNRPAIARSSTANLPDLAVTQPLVSRERRHVAAENAPVLATRPRRETAVAETPPEKTTISRSRGATAMDMPAAKDRIVVRRAQSGELPAAGSGIPQRPVVRSERSASPLEESAPRVIAARERTKLASGGEGESSASIGLARGVSLQSLEICSSPQLQEEGIMAILRVVGSRQSCTDEKGEFQFKGTKRISSFNLMIFPSPGRKPSNRCEELENAYKCLKAH
jgi:hypothetical protein